VALHNHISSGERLVVAVQRHSLTPSIWSTTNANGQSLELVTATFHTYSKLSSKLFFCLLADHFPRWCPTKILFKAPVSLFWLYAQPIVASLISLC
jgi:hypothetical protein